MLCVLYAALMAVMYATGTAAVPADRIVDTLLHTQRGWVLIGAVVLLSATYPRFGFVRRTFAGDLARHRDTIIAAFAEAGYRLQSETAGAMSFRAEGFAKRLRLLGEDEITVETAGGGEIAVDGIRRVAVPVAMRLETRIKKSEDE